MPEARRGVEPLPLSLRNSIRSGILVFDLTRVVEELLFNSLDASATKVSVFLGAETGCVKVVDNGSGISRDGLVLLGERYVLIPLHYVKGLVYLEESKMAKIGDIVNDHFSCSTYIAWDFSIPTVTSKLCNDTFGFRGETLASISDVSLLEIVTRTSGRPNGYRKVIKGSKCLYFGIDDNRKDVGTTIVVRDLFYNQPVRRKFFQSSPKKVLQSVKQCVLRVALVHSKVSFKIIDNESENELLCTYHSSAMSILMSDYGIDEVNSLHKLNVSDGFLSLSGYITGPSDDLSAKAFQYVYINSRFVFNGPIHKLLNHLAMTFEGLDSWSEMYQKGKRSRTQAYMAYIMNLYCPRDLYDLTLEPSKTYAEFKDWGPILTFIQKAIQQVWSKIIAGESSSQRVDLHSRLSKRNDDATSTKKEGHDLDVILPETSEVASDKFQGQQCYLACSPRENLKKHSDETFNWNCNEATYHSFDFHDDIREDGHNKRQTHRDGMPGNHLSSIWQNDSSEIESAKVELSSDHEAWRKQLESSVSGYNRYRNDGDFTLQEFEVDVSDFNDEVEMRFICQSGFSKQPMDVSHRVRTPIMAQDCYSSHFTSCNSFEFSDDKFIKDSENIRQKYSDDMQGNLLSSDWHNDSPKDDSGNIVLSSDDKMWHKQLKFGESVRDPFLHGCSFTRSLSCGKGLLNNEEEAEYPISEPQFPDDKFLKEKHNIIWKYNDDMEGNCSSFDWQNEYLKDGAANIGSSSDHEAWNRHLKVGENTKDHFSRGFSLTRNLSCKGLLNRKDETEFTVAEPQLKRRRVCFSEDIDVLEYETSNQRDDIFLGQGKQTFAADVGSPSDFVQHIGSISSGNIFLRSNPDSETSNTLLQACWGVENFPRDITDEVSGRSYEKEKKTQLLSLHFPHMSRDEVDWQQLDLQSECQNSCDRFSDKCDKLGYKNGKKDVLSNYSRRSHSAPPFYRQKRKFVSFNGSLSAGRKPQDQVVDKRDNKISYLVTNSIGELHSATRPEAGNEQSTVPQIEEVIEGKKVVQHCTVAHKSAGECFTSSGCKEFENFGIKWRDCSQVIENKPACDIDSHHSILDITSRFLSLTGSLLIPDSLHKNFLKEAKVLHQVDKKFIPVVADGTLAIIDQHAADERIRLEELQDKVLSGKARTISYLDAEQELILPEFGYQLLPAYADQIRDWGWICKMRSQDSGIFDKNMNVMHQNRAMVTLIAVPCILGVNLSCRDLLEFLQQLADTDGASTVPPCVVRILNLKACRGAIMFGDSLLPSECALIVEELEKTRLCFQCAHGRPTTVPLVKLATLHCEIGVLKKEDKDDSFLRRQEIGIIRAAQRLALASGQLTGSSMM
ncbi:DNA mismatch repair protein MLH3 [Linum perenne]